MTLLDAADVVNTLVRELALQLTLHEVQQQQQRSPLQATSRRSTEAIGRIQAAFYRSVACQYEQRHQRACIAM
jgi:hypothetical protein